MNANSEEGKPMNVQIQGAGQFFIEEQYQQLVRLLSKPTTKEISNNFAGIVSLLSDAVSKLTKDLYCSATFFPDLCTFQDLCSGSVMGIGRENNGELRYFLGIEILRSKEGILLTQRKYALQLISEAGLAAAKPISTPIELNQILTTIDYDKHVGVKGYEELEDIVSYQRLIGKLLYLTITRPDLSFAVQVLSQFIQHPKQSYWDASLCVVRYVKSAPGFGILLSTGPINYISAYCDSNWASCLNTRRSVIRYIIKLGDSLLFWKCMKQQTVSRSSA
ncbi:PREDICTED: uncharacterized protein LOC109237766 [Nicotiana attenuata]|uniref:uncharacterized protein LOC109237766 n=1 Tax=Nicotiana attenuata TaxID=49451 RepID=UPI000904C373|nr:PREDICTED: uncharacterized protein LOC109237766 [Nicotiana attenuata]